MRRLSPQALWTARALRFARYSLGVRFLVALALSALVWAGLTIEENPVATEPFPGRLIVEPVGLDTRSLVLVEGIAPVRVSVSGPKVNLASLTADHFVARVNLSQLSAGRHQVDVDVVVSDSQVEVVRVTPENISVELDPVVERQLRVNARIESDVATGYRADLSGITAEPAEATVSGASSAVERVARVQAALSLEGATRDVRVEGLLIPVDRQGVEVEDVRVDPPTVLVNVPVTRITGRKRVPVVPRIERGRGRRRSTIARIGVVPTSVEIEGEPGALERVDAVETLPIDIADARSDVQREVGFEAPEGITIQQRSAVRGRLRWWSSRSTRLRRSRSRWSSRISAAASRRSPTSHSCRSSCRARRRSCRACAAGDILAEVDLSNRAPGLHQIRPVITNPAPDTLRMVQHTPAVVDVRISPLEAPSPAPAATAIPGPGGAVPAATPTPTQSAG